MIDQFEYEAYMLFIIVNMFNSHCLYNRLLHFCFQPSALKQSFNQLSNGKNSQLLSRQDARF